jgi:hypothetical protein
MDIPTPKPAQVIRYSYLWADEYGSGIDEGRKDRPAAVVLTVRALQQMTCELSSCPSLMQRLPPEVTHLKFHPRSSVTWDLMMRGLGSS